MAADPPSAGAPSAVSVPGTFGVQVGCPGDYAPDCLRSWLQDVDGDGTSTFTTDAIPAGDYVVKAALGLSWGVSFGTGAEPGRDVLGEGQRGDAQQVLRRQRLQLGDWFNALDPTLTDPGFGRGLPPAADDQELWPFAKPRLADPAPEPTPAAQRTSAAQVRTMLTIHKNSPLLHLGSAAAIQDKISFPLSGPAESPGVIVQQIDDTRGADADPARDGLMLVFNASPEATHQTVPGAAGQGWSLVPSQRWGSDATVRRSGFDAGAGAFSVLARTVAVFERR